jgi:uncharacterized membrane protein YphA (DoxX/SURF4 family)
MAIAIIFIIGRVIFGFYWLEVGYKHLKHTAMLAGYAQSKGIKSSKAAVVVSGIMALLGGISIILGTWPRIGIALIALFLLGVTYKMHAYWKVTDPQAKQMEKVQFGKNMALFAAALMLFTIALPWVWSL